MSPKCVYQRAEIHSAKWDLNYTCVNRHEDQSESEAIAQSHPARAILLAEDDDAFRSLLAEELRRDGYSVTECCDGVELVSHLDGYVENRNPTDETQRFDLIISDIRMPGVFGLSIVEGTQQHDSFPPTILMTAFPDSEILETAQRCGVLAVFGKPFEIEDLLDVVRQSFWSCYPTRRSTQWHV